MKDLRGESKVKSKVLPGPGSSDLVPDDEIIDLTEKNTATTTLAVAGSLPLVRDPSQKTYGNTSAAGAVARRSGGIQMSGPDPYANSDGKGRIGDRLVAQGIITVEQLNVALQEKKISGAGCRWLLCHTDRPLR